MGDKEGEKDTGILSDFGEILESRGQRLSAGNALPACWWVRKFKLAAGQLKTSTRSSIARIIVFE